MTTKAEKKILENKVLALRKENPNLSVDKIGKVVDRHKSQVSRILKKYDMELSKIEHFKENRGNIFAGIQDKLLASIKPEDIEKINALQRITGAAIIYDKERLETNKSTQNILLADVIEKQDREDRKAFSPEIAEEHREEHNKRLEKSGLTE